MRIVQGDYYGHPNPSRSLHTYAFNSSGTGVTDHRPIVGEDNETLRFTQPIDVTVHPTGRAYVADFGNWESFGDGGVIWVLNAVAPK